MSMQFSPFGIAIIAILYAVIAVIAILLWHFFRSIVSRVLISVVALVAVSLPIAEEAWIAWHFAKLCEDAGVHIKRKVAADGFLETTSSYYRASNAKVGPIGRRGELFDFEKAGYRFKESQLNGGVWHLEREGDQLIASLRDIPEARYQYGFTDPRQDVPVGHRLKKYETVIIDRETGETIARDTRYKRYPGWVESLWIGFFGSGLTICAGVAPKPPALRHLLYHYVLIPPNPR
jgi:hypothetical protein